MLRQVLLRSVPIGAVALPNARAKLSTATKNLDVIGYVADDSLYAVDENETVFNATAKMVKNNVGCLVVTRDPVGGTAHVIGIVTERDYLKKVVHEGRTSHNTAISEIATLGSELVVATPGDTIHDMTKVMVSKNIRHLPIVNDEGQLLTMVSMRDLAKAWTTMTPPPWLK